MARKQEPRNKIILQLKDELNAALELISNSRKLLSDRVYQADDDKFLRRLKDMTASFNSLTESKIRLDKAERAMEADMTPEEERAAVKSYLADLLPSELRALVAEIRRERGAEHGDWDPEPEPASGN